MTIALKIGDEKSSIRGLLYFDVVTSFGETGSGTVTSFPLDMGVPISDHFIGKNQTYQLKGLLSSADLSGVSDSIRVDDQKPINANASPKTPAILEFATGVAQLLPGSLQQFYKTSIPDVYDGGSVAPSISQVKEILRELMVGVSYNTTSKRYQNKMTTITLYEFDDTTIKSQITDLVLTNFSIDEDADTGDCIPLSLSLEHVRFVGVEKVAPATKAATKKTSKKNIKKPTKKECIVGNDAPSGIQNSISDPKMLNATSFDAMRFAPIVELP